METLNQKDREELNNYYFNPALPSSLGGFSRFNKSLPSHLRGDRAEKWMSEQETYTRFKPARTRFPRRPTIAAGMNEQLQGDLVDVRAHKAENDGICFLLTLIDVFSKKAWVFPLKNKTGVEVAQALSSFFSKENFRCFQTDKGKEFFNGAVETVLKRNGVEHINSENETIKASIVERFNRTLRLRLHRFIHQDENGRYIDNLTDIVSAYNNSPHSSIGMTPNEVTFENQEEVWDNLYRTDEVEWVKKKRPKFAKGDHVLISSARSSFERGFTPNWSQEIFKITNILTENHPITYNLADLNGEEIRGGFYSYELQKVSLPETFKIEKIIRSRRRNGKKEFLVKWLGYNEDFNSWVKASDMV